jgi:hypothetical protein
MTLEPEDRRLVLALLPPDVAGAPAMVDTVLDALSDVDRPIAGIADIVTRLVRRGMHVRQQIDEQLAGLLDPSPRDILDALRAHPDVESARWAEDRPGSIGLELGPVVERIRFTPTIRFTDPKDPT